MPARRETCGWAGLPSGKVVWVLMLQLLQGPSPNRRPSCGRFSSWVDLDLIPSSISGRNSSPTTPQTSSSLPITLLPHVPFPQHRSGHLLACTTQRTNTLRGEQGPTHFPVGLLPAELSARSPSCRNPSLRDAWLVAGWTQPASEQGCPAVEQRCCILLTGPGESRCRRASAVPKPVLARRAGG